MSEVYEVKDARSCVPIWVVVKYWPGGKRETIAAFFDEEKARFRAGQEVGRDGGLIALETFNVFR